MLFKIEYMTYVLIGKQQSFYIKYYVIMKLQLKGNFQGSL